MCPTSSAGPDGYNGVFYQRCWHIINKEVVNVVQSLFKGNSLTKYYTHTCLVLIPKVESPTCFSNLRPISLSNFSSKIITKVLSRRMNPLLPKLISENQSGFVKGRAITENVLLTHEIVHGISEFNRGSSMMIKLDMAKAYGRMSWPFLTSVMRQFGFSEGVIKLIWRLLARVWYIIIINGKREGFFTSAQGLKRGDPLSTSLFIIGAEVLSRLLNKLLSDPKYVPFIWIRGDHRLHILHIRMIWLSSLVEMNTLSSRSLSKSRSMRNHLGGS